MPHAGSRRAFLLACCLVASGGLTGCSIGSSFQRGFAEQMALAVLDNDDPETVRAGAPAFLLIMDGQVRNDPTNSELLLAAGGLYAAYATAFVDDEERAARLSGRALRYGNQALQVEHPDVPSLRDCTQDEFRAILEGFSADDGALVASLGQIWLAWIRARPDDLDAVADLPRIEELFERALQLGHDEDGGVHLNLAILRGMDTLMGMGDLDAVRADFEAALEKSDRQNLMVHVAYARMYAEPAGDQELFEALLDEVISAEVHAPGRTLMNVLARERALALRAGEDPGWSF